MRQFLKKINPFKRAFSESEREKIQFLKRNTLFQTLSEEEIARFLPYLHLREYQQEEVIFFRNDPSQALYLIKSGSVRLALDVQEKFEELVILKAHDHMGENSLLESSSRLYNAISCEAETEVYLIPQINLQEILRSDLTLKAKLHEALLNDWNRHTHALFKIYRESFAFFELGKAYFSDHF
ncbi:cyclic nucleotide-binding domain-containing protein [Hugenholtzia roseola]|uniref:cyclic nucleotide-binding domain-containing protein n=1 Tax=Hugenholtzia roseola TaxID=1002 RepID=UPI0003FF147A|nr:cyclic nucleotide-binding domain-containing protein [Hugenholtzia roseola]